MSWLKNKVTTQLIVISILLRSLYVILVHDTEASQIYLPSQYVYRAEMLLSGGTSLLADAWGLFYQIVAVFFGLAGWLGLHSPASRITFFVVVQTIIVDISLLFFYQVSKKITSEKIALFSTLFLAFYYPLLYVNTLVITESISTALLIFLMYLIAIKGNSKFSYLMQAIVIGLLVICRPAFIPSVPVYFIWVLFFSRDIKLSLKNLGITLKEVFSKDIVSTLILQCLIIFIILFTGAYVNHKTDSNHRYSLNGSGGVNFAITQCRYKKYTYSITNPKTESFWFSPPSFKREDITVEKTSEVPFYNHLYYFKEGISCLISKPLNLLGDFENIGRIYRSVFYPATIVPSWHSYVMSLWRHVSVILTLLFLWYSELYKNQNKRVYNFSLLMLLSLYLTVFLANPGEERYIVPYFSMLLLFGVPVASLLTGKVFKIFRKSS